MSLRTIIKIILLTETNNNNIRSHPLDKKDIPLKYVLCPIVSLLFLITEFEKVLYYKV